MSNKLLLLSGNDIPFVKAQINIRQPKIKDIAFLGEDTFYLGCNFLCFSKEDLDEKDKISLTKYSNFDILMSIVNNKTDEKAKANVLLLELMFSLLFPDYQLMIMPSMLVLTRIIEEKKEQCIINNDNFEQFKVILNQMFCLDKVKGQDDYNPANKAAEAIANKLRQRHKKLNKKQGGQNKSIDILSRYISILSLGNHNTITELMDYTIYQLNDAFQRFERKYSYQVYLQFKAAGAQGLQEIDNWMGQKQDKIETRSRSNRYEF